MWDVISLFTVRKERAPWCHCWVSSTLLLHTLLIRVTSAAACPCRSWSRPPAPGRACGWCAGSTPLPGGAGNRRFGSLRALRAHTEAPYKTCLLWETLRAPKRPGRAGPDGTRSSASASSSQSPASRCARPAAAPTHRGLSTTPHPDHSYSGLAAAADLVLVGLLRRRLVALLEPLLGLHQIRRELGHRVAAALGALLRPCELLLQVVDLRRAWAATGLALRNIAPKPR